MNGYVRNALYALEAGQVRWSENRGPEAPRGEREVEIDGFGWVKADGHFLAGLSGGQYIHHDPGFMDRRRLRRAVRRWAQEAMAADPLKYPNTSLAVPAT